MNQLLITECQQENAQLFEDVNDEIWQTPELRFKEHRSSAIQIETMEKLGFRIETNIGNLETAFMASAGGEMPNVVQSEASLIYAARCPQMDDLQGLFDKLRNIASGAALMTDTKVDVQLMNIYANVLPNETLSDIVWQNMQKVLPFGLTSEEEAYARSFTQSLPEELQTSLLSRAKNHGITYAPVDNYIENMQGIIQSVSNDVGNVSWVVPTAIFTLACYAQGTPGHSWQITAQGKSSIVHKGMHAASAIFALMLAGFIINKVSLAITSLLAMIALVLTGCIDGETALACFSNSNAILIVSIFIVAEGLSRTQMVKKFSNLIYKVSSGSERKILIGYVALTCLLAQFVSSAVAVFGIVFPIALSMCKNTNIKPSKIMFPIAVTAIATVDILPAGGGATLAAQYNGYLETYGYTEYLYGFMDFCKGRIPILLTVVLFAVFIIPRFAPEYEQQGTGTITGKNVKDREALSPTCLGKTLTAILLAQCFLGHRSCLHRL
ncbi:MAG: hypothetical protein HFG41_00350 [Coprococcus sp.]|nr:hypothetical protein [Coprococcus sp.]